MGAFFLLVYSLPAIVAFTFVFSLLPSLAIRYSHRQIRRCYFCFLVFLSILFILLIIATYFTCNFGYDPKCLSYKSYTSGNYDICEDAANLIIQDRCYMSTAIWAEDLSLCEKVTRADECTIHIQNMINSRGGEPLVPLGG